MKYRETLNFFIIIEDNEEVLNLPIHLFFSSGGYTTGQKLIGMIQARKAPRYACRFRAISSVATNKRGESWQNLEILNDPQPWVAETNFHSYEKLYEELKKLISSNQLDLDTSSVEETESTEF